MLSRHWSELKPCRRKIDGVRVVNLSRNGRRLQKKVGCLVLETFVGPRPPGLECCHGDDDQDNNRLGNLRWDTHQSNMDDQFLNGARHRKLTRARRCQVTEAEVVAIRALGKDGFPGKRVAKIYSLSRSQVWKIQTGFHWGRIPLEK